MFLAGTLLAVGNIELVGRKYQIYNVGEKQANCVFFSSFFIVFRYRCIQQRTWEFPSKDPLLLSSHWTFKWHYRHLDFCHPDLMNLGRFHGTSMILQKTFLTCATLIQTPPHLQMFLQWMDYEFSVTCGLFSKWACAEEPYLVLELLSCCCEEVMCLYGRAESQLEPRWAESTWDI